MFEASQFPGSRTPPADSVHARPVRDLPAGRARAHARGECGCLTAAFRSQANTLFGMYDMFVGQAFSKATIFALGIMPYIRPDHPPAPPGAVVPYFEKLRKEGEEGQKKITQITRYGTVLISVVQSFAYAVFLIGLGQSQACRSCAEPGPMFYLSTVITQTAGTILVMWLGEDHGVRHRQRHLADHLRQHSRRSAQRTRRHVRQHAGRQFPRRCRPSSWPRSSWRSSLPSSSRRRPRARSRCSTPSASWAVASTVAEHRASRSRVNTAGVIPIIFASSIMVLPATVAGFFANNPAARRCRSSSTARASRST